ncbi:MAG TPA: RNA polymerase sigma factor [Lacipirellulaceae bacterium]|jgi:RNA polymerase sigma-70 factor (ECF subfamily)
MPLPTDSRLQPDADAAGSDGFRADGAPSGELLPDEAIVARVLGGDVASFELIMRRYNQRLFRVARSIVGEDTEAEDVVQEAYVNAYQHLAQFEGRAQFSTWLTRIAVYEASARRRKRQRLQLVTSSEVEIESMEIRSANRDAAEEASQRELGSLLATAVEALPAELRLVFTLRLVERLSTQETAECLELTPANVKVRLHRARLMLRSWIDQRIGKETRQLYAFDGERCNRIVARVSARIAGGITSAR